MNDTNNQASPMVEEYFDEDHDKYSVEDFVQSIKYDIKKASEIWNGIRYMLEYSENHGINADDMKLVIEQTADALGEGQDVVHGICYDAVQEWGFPHLFP